MNENDTMPKKLKKYTILGFEWFEGGGPFCNIRQFTILDQPLRDDLANDLFDYEIESIKNKKSTFIALSMFNDSTVEKIREYDPENVLDNEKANEEYSVWSD
jgi:hypothetical protein